MKNNAETIVRERLFELQDLSYRDFASSLMPTVNKETVIGVRTPKLRSFAKDFAKTDEASVFLKSLPHNYYEENNLHSFIIERIKDFPTALAAVEEFLPYVNNWATCDTMCPKIFKKHTDELLVKIRLWLKSEETYTVRYGLNMLMRFFLDDKFKAEYLELASSVKSSEYYVNMMIAWLFATALAKQYEATLPYIEKRKLDSWTHNKTIQKAVESYRVTDEHKAYLKTLKVK